MIALIARLQDLVKDPQIALILLPIPRIKRTRDREKGVGNGWQQCLEQRRGRWRVGCGDGARVLRFRPVRSAQGGHMIERYLLTFCDDDTVEDGWFVVTS
jgi:hypothetical protein